MVNPYINKRQLYISCLLLLTLTFCKKEKQTISEPNRLILSESFNIENSTIDRIFISNYDNIALFLDEHKSKVYYYNSTLNQANLLGSKGRGPGEYLSASKVIFDAIKKKFAVYDVDNAKFIYYDNNYKYLYEEIDKFSTLWDRGYTSYVEPDNYFLSGIYEPQFATSSNQNFMQSRTIAAFEGDSILFISEKIPKVLHKLDRLHVGQVNNQNYFKKKFIQTWLTEPYIRVYSYSKEGVVLDFEINEYPQLFKILENKPTINDDMLTRRKKMTSNSYVRSIHLVDDYIYLIFSNYTMQGHLEQNSGLFEYFIAVYNINKKSWVFEMQLNEIILGVDFNHILYTNDEQTNFSLIKKYKIQLDGL